MSLRIAIDFDGTIVEHAYPNIGKEKLFAIETMKLLQKNGHRLILWTIRTGKELEEAVTYCRERGVEFYAVNKSYPEEEWTGEASRKIEADVFIDDRNIGGLPGWTDIYRMIHPEDYPGSMLEKKVIRHRKWWKKLKIFGNS
ncbi:MAG: BT0820 family HAD-type phosphatase [Bacteroidales bacterium]